MNNQSPLIPQGSFEEQKNRGRARVKIAVFFVLAIHAVGLMALLMQGCRQEKNTPTEEPTPTNNPAMMESTNAMNGADTNAMASAQGGTNAMSGPEASAQQPGQPGTPAAAAQNAQQNMAPTPEAPQTQPTPAVEPPTPGSSATAVAGGDYKVVKGDTMKKIAVKSHVTLKALTDANPGVSSTKLKVGQTLHLPASSVSAAGAASTSTESAATTSVKSASKVYTVRSGDTLRKVAAANHVTTAALRKANKLTSDKIHVGQKLKIPAKSAVASKSAKSSKKTKKAAPASTAPTAPSTEAPTAPEAPAPTAPAPAAPAVPEAPAPANNAPATH